MRGGLVRVGRSAASRFMGSRAGGFAGRHLGGLAAAGTTAYLGYRGIKGFASQVIPGSIDAAMDVTFGDPQADRAVLGTDLTPSIYLGARGPGIIGSTARGINATRFGFGAHNPTDNTIGVGVVGGLLGGVYGAAKGYKSGGIRGAIGGAAVGAIGGGVIGGSIGAITVARQAYATGRANAQIINESPFYNRSALTAERLNASGNIVFGMHNQRRG